MVCICVMLLLPNVPVLNILCVAIIVLTTLYSGGEYLLVNRSVFASMK